MGRRAAAAKKDIPGILDVPAKTAPAGGEVLLVPSERTGRTEPTDATGDRVRRAPRALLARSVILVSLERTEREDRQGSRAPPARVVSSGLPAFRVLPASEAPEDTLDRAAREVLMESLARADPLVRRERTGLKVGAGVQVVPDPPVKRAREDSAGREARQDPLAVLVTEAIQAPLAPPVRGVLLEPQELAVAPGPEAAPGHLELPGRAE